MGRAPGAALGNFERHGQLRRPTRRRCRRRTAGSPMQRHARVDPDRRVTGRDDSLDSRPRPDPRRRAGFKEVRGKKVDEDCDRDREDCPRGARAQRPGDATCATTLDAAADRSWSTGCSKGDKVTIACGPRLQVRQARRQAFRRARARYDSAASCDARPLPGAVVEIRMYVTRSGPGSALTFSSRQAPRSSRSTSASTGGSKGQAKPCRSGQPASRGSPRWPRARRGYAVAAIGGDETASEPPVKSAATGLPAVTPAAKSRSGGARRRAGAARAEVRASASARRHRTGPAARPRRRPPRPRRRRRADGGSDRRPDARSDARRGHDRLASAQRRLESRRVGEGDQGRRLRDRGNPRARRHGRGLRGAPAVARAHRRAEDPGGDAGDGPVVQGALPPRGADPGHPRPPAHRHDLRGRRVGRLAVHRDAARARAEPQGDDHRARARGRADAADPAADRGGARLRARGRADPSRHQAPEHPRRVARPRVPGRLRADEGHRRRRADADRPVRGHDRLHRAGADPGRAGDGRVRHLRALGGALRVPDRRGAVSEAVGRGGHVRAPLRAAAAGHRPAPGAAAEPRRGHLQGDGQGPGGALRDGDGPDRRGRARARQARAGGDHAARADRGPRGGGHPREGVAGPDAPRARAAQHRSGPRRAAGGGRPDDARRDAGARPGRSAAAPAAAATTGPTVAQPADPTRAAPAVGRRSRACRCRPIRPAPRPRSGRRSAPADATVASPAVGPRSRSRPTPRSPRPPCGRKSRRPEACRRSTPRRPCRAGGVRLESAPPCRARRADVESAPAVPDRRRQSIRARRRPGRPPPRPPTARRLQRSGRRLGRHRAADGRHARRRARRLRAPAAGGPGLLAHPRRRRRRPRGRPGAAACRAPRRLLAVPVDRGGGRDRDRRGRGATCSASPPTSRRRRRPTRA